MFIRTTGYVSPLLGLAALAVGAFGVAAPAAASSLDDMISPVSMPTVNEDPRRYRAPSRLFEKLYPLFEFNWRYNLRGGGRLPIDQEGWDLVNLGWRVTTDIIWRPMGWNAIF